MTKRETYWDLLKAYRKELYNSKLYWASGFIILIGFALFFLQSNLAIVGSYLLTFGIILLIISKLIVLNKEVI